MKHQCSQCKRSIADYDFFVRSRTGKICSSCLVDQQLPGSEVKALFKDNPARRVAGEMGNRDLEAEPLFLARSGG